MNRKYAAAAVSALALGAVALNTAEASAQETPEPQCGNTIPANCPKYDPAHHGNMSTPEYNYPAYKLDQPTSPSDATHAPGKDARGGVPAGASTLGAAGVGLGLWLYWRRRHPAA